MANPINYFDDLIKRLSKAGNATYRVPEKEILAGWHSQPNVFFPEGMPEDTQVWKIDPHNTLASIAYPPRLREEALSRVADSPYQIPISPYGRVDTLYVYPTTSTLRNSPLPSMGLYGAAQSLSGGNYKYHIAGAGPNALNTARHEIRHGVANPALEYVDGSQDYGQYLRSDDEMLSRLGSMSDLYVAKYGKLITSPKAAERAVDTYWVNNEMDVPANVYMDDFANSKQMRDKMTDMLQRLLTVPAVGAAASSQMDNSNQRR